MTTERQSWNCSTMGGKVIKNIGYVKETEAGDKISKSKILEGIKAVRWDMKHNRIGD